MQQAFYSASIQVLFCIHDWGLVHTGTRDIDLLTRFEAELRQIAKSMKNDPNNRTKNEGTTLEKRIIELKKRQPFVVNGNGNLASVSDHSEVVEMWKKEERKYQLKMKATFYERAIVKVAAVAIIGFAGYKYGLPYLTPFVDNFRGAAKGIERLEKRGDLTKYGLEESGN